MGDLAETFKAQVLTNKAWYEALVAWKIEATDLSGEKDF